VRQREIKRRETRGRWGRRKNRVEKEGRNAKADSCIKIEAISKNIH
jgi:hypothetical protein